VPNCVDFATATLYNSEMLTQQLTYRRSKNAY
jgi:hypothetical protein